MEIMSYFFLIFMFEIFQFSFRREACDIQATKARNDYVLALLAANAHQSKFYETDLPELVMVSVLMYKFFNANFYNILLSEKFLFNVLCIDLKLN